MIEPEASGSSGRRVLLSFSWRGLEFQMESYVWGADEAAAQRRIVAVGGISPATSSRARFFQTGERLTALDPHLRFAVLDWHSIDRGDAPQDAFLTMPPKHFVGTPSQAFVDHRLEGLSGEEREAACARLEKRAQSIRDSCPHSHVEAGQVLRAVIAEGLGWGAPGKKFVIGGKSWSGGPVMSLLAEAARAGGESFQAAGAILIHPGCDAFSVPPALALHGIPTILGWAKDDSKVPYSLSELYTAVDSVELVTFERGGHHAFDGSGGLPNFDDSIDAWYRKHFLSQDDGLLIGVDGQFREQEVLGRDIVGARGRVGADAADLAAGAVTEVDGRVLASLIVAGFARLSSRADELNAINVFPVADKDTGVNMKVCLEVPARNLLLEPSSSVLVVASNMAADARLHGQGNSGTILSNFFISLAEELAALGPRHAVSIGELASCLAATGGKMADAVSDPKEGTIVSVARDSCASLAGGQSYATLLELLEAWWASCAAALAMTPEQLIVDGVNVLEKAGVVDSGAQGFCYMVEGMLLACRGELAGAGDASVFASGSVAGERPLRRSGLLLLHRGYPYGQAHEGLLVGPQALPHEPPHPRVPNERVADDANVLPLLRRDVDHIERAAVLEIPNAIALTTGHGCGCVPRGLIQAPLAPIEALLLALVLVVLIVLRPG